MPESLTGFNEQDAAALIDLIDSNGTDLPALPPRSQRASGGGDTGIVRITSTTPTSGMYPCKIQLYDYVNGWSDLDDAWYLPANAGEVPTAERRFARRVALKDSDSRLVFAADHFVPTPLTVATTNPGTGDSTVSTAGVTTIQVDQGSGAYLVEVSAGVVKVGTHPASTTHAGVVNLTTQSFTGIKTFALDVNVLGGLFVFGNSYLYASLTVDGSYFSNTGNVKLAHGYLWTGTSGYSKAVQDYAGLLVSIPNLANNDYAVVSRFTVDTNSKTMVSNAYLADGSNDYVDFIVDAANGRAFLMRGLGAGGYPTTPARYSIYDAFTNTYYDGQTVTEAGMIFVGGLRTGGAFASGGVALSLV